MSETEAGSEDRRHEQPFVAKGADDVLNELGARPDGGPAPAVQAQAERYARGFLAQSGVREYKQPMPADHTGSREDWERNKLLAQQAWEVKQAGIQANWEKLRAKDHIGTLREAQQKVPLMPVAEVTKEARNRNLNHSEQLHEGS
jgi:hypothetical protein